MTTDEQNTCFERWLADHTAVLHHVANGFAEGADRHDLMQELLLAVWRAVPAFRQSARPSTFIYRVAHNAALTWKRTERNYRSRVDRYEAWGDHEAPSGSLTAERERETLALLYATIRTFPSVERSLILLHLDGVSYAEMAEIHGLTENNIGVRLNRLKQKLTTALEDVTHELR